MGLFTVISWLLKLSSSALLKDVAKVFINQSDNESKIALAQINAEIEARKNAREIRLQTAGFIEMRFITFSIAACFTLHLVAVTLDTVFALGWQIAKFPAPIDQWEGYIITSFFGIHGLSLAINGLISGLRK